MDGLILPDVPYEEKEEFDGLCRQYGLDLISLIAPTSEQRIAMIAKEASGFIYIVSSLGVTGTRSEIKTDISAMVDLIRQNTSLPCAVGFGIATPQQAAAMPKSAMVPSSAAPSSSSLPNTAPPPCPTSKPLCAIWHKRYIMRS